MITVSKDITKGFAPSSLPTEEAILKFNWSCGIFKEGYRNKANFLRANTIALDFDNAPDTPQISLVDAKKQIIESGLEAIIATTRSHRIDKKDQGKKDRFRVIIRLAEEVTTPEDFTATWEALADLFPAADTRCKDASRFYYPSKKVVLKTEGKKRWPVTKYVKPDAPKTEKIGKNFRGKLSRATTDFLLFGAPAGQWNGALTKATIDLQEQNYSIEEAKKLLQIPTRYGVGELDSNDHKTIDFLFSQERKYGPRGLMFDFKRAGELPADQKELKWIVDGLLVKGGMSILTAAPKIGKSVLARNLMKSVVYGDEFLGRKTEKATVMYVALEDHPIMVDQDLRRLGVKPSDDFFIHCGSVKKEGAMDALSESIKQLGAGLVVIDTLALFLHFSDINNYAEVNAPMESLREVARSTGAHILTIHHANKSGDSDSRSILGSSAIFGAVDCSIVISKGGETGRVITTQQRGGTPFRGARLNFDEKNLIYTLGGLSDGF